MYIYISSHIYNYNTCNTYVYIYMVYNHSITHVKIICIYMHIHICTHNYIYSCLCMSCICISLYIYILFSEIGTNLWQGSRGAFMLIIYLSTMVPGFARCASMCLPKKKCSVQYIPQCGYSNDETTVSQPAKVGL